MRFSTGGERVVGKAWAWLVFLTITVWTSSDTGAKAGEAPVFTDIEAAIPSLRLGSVDWGDYDNDGDLDLLLTGETTGFIHITAIYENDGGEFSNSGIVLPGVTGEAKWGDAYGDGRLDIGITGEDNAGNPLSTVYLNDGLSPGSEFNEFFLSIHMEGMSNGSLDWGDGDKDGTADIAISGTDELGNPRLEIYRLLTSGIGTRGVEGFENSDVAWMDYNGDGNLDLLVAGLTNEPAFETVIYQNEGSFMIGDQFGAVDVGLPGADFGGVDWADYDNDGDPDVLMAGRGAQGILTGIFRNDNGSFVNVGAGLVPLGRAAVAWGDYDNDGDPDALTAGVDDDGFPRTILYENEEGVFTDSGLILPNLADPSLAWGDYDQDGDLDLALLGTAAGEVHVTKIYRNDLVREPMFQELALDLPQVDRGDAEWADIDGDGDLDFAITGDAGLPTEPSKRNVIPTGAGGTSADAAVYRNDGDNQFTKLDVVLAPVQQASIDWGDFDNDGDPDLLWSGFGEFGDVTQIYRNDGSGNFSLLVAGLQGVSDGEAAWGDYDGDGLPDVMVTGDSNDISLAAQLYRSLGGGDFTSVDFGFPEAAESDFDFGDYDTDGHLDIVLCGWLGGSETTTTIFQNLNNGSDYQQLDAELPGIRGGTADWADYDMDGDLDLLLTGNRTEGSGFTFISAIYRNDEGAFHNALVELLGVDESAAAWGDYDGDGDPDLVILGSPRPTEASTRIYRNDDGRFINIGADLPELFSGSVDWGDYDADGDLDLLLTGRMEDGTRVTKIFQNVALAPGTEPVVALDFTAGDERWTGRKFGGDVSLGGSWEQSAAGLCMSVAAGGANGVEWRSPRGLFDVAQRTVYRVTLRMSTDQTVTGQIPTWDVTWSNVQENFFLNFGGRRWFVDTEGGAQGIGLPQGRNEFVIYVAPAAIDLPQWNGEGSFTGMGAFTSEAAANLGVRLIVRVLDFDESLQASARSGTICVESIEIEAVPLVELTASTTEVYNVPLSSTTHRAFRGSTVPDPLTTASFDNAQNLFMLQHPSAAQATVSPIVATLSPDDDSEPAFVEDPVAGTVRNALRRFPVPSEADTTYILAAGIYAPGATTNPIDIIDLAHDAYTIEWGGSSWVTSGDAGVTGGMAGAASPKPLASTGGTSPRWMDFVHINNPTASVIENAQRWRPQVDFFNRPDIGIMNPKDQTGTNPLTVDELSVERVN